MWMRLMCVCLWAGGLWAQSAGEEREVVAVAQKFMDVLAARDSGAGKFSHCGVDVLTFVQNSRWPAYRVSGEHRRALRLPAQAIDPVTDE